MIHYNVIDLNSAREFLKSTDETEIVLNNPLGSTRYYGMRVIDYMFSTLKKEFPEKVVDVILTVYDDRSALVTALKLKYGNMNIA